MAPDPSSQAGQQKSSETETPASGQGAPARQVLARGVLPVRSEASLSAAMLPLRPSRAGTFVPSSLRGQLGWVGVAGASVVAFTALLGVLSARTKAPRATSASSVASVLPAAHRPFVSVALRATVPGVRFRFEDGREAASPYLGLVAYDERPQAVLVEADGYAPATLSLRFNDDVTIDDLRLVPVAPAAPAHSSVPTRRAPDHSVLLPRPGPKR
jgi:hypothetical protein